ncbi:MAG TPA: 16S rRNA (cytosine(1402)-N(4))-methyltransferase RsmH [Candidatus Andersenbacteria bacterium]|nr:16S rRNA (cytosine(1402)-N(4))-methyltransferase RsmH [Candidatus Andersenbacteria bacterium]
MSEHIPVLLKEVIELLEPKAGDTLLDGTLGHGGHARAFLEKAGEGSNVIGIDADEAALAQAKEELQEFGDRVTYIHGNFYSIPDAHVQAALFDLGIGSHQLADEERGFSFSSEGPLDMRYGDHEHLPDSWIPQLNDLAQQLHRYPNADDIVNKLAPLALSEVIRRYGEERYAGVLANSIVDARPIKDAKHLRDVIVNAVPKSYEHGRIHPATRTFQALRIAVNRELEVLEAALPKAVEIMEDGGVLAVISFHSLEDRIVKNYFREQAKSCICPPEQVVCTCNHPPTLTILTKKPIVASEEEIVKNPRARSAKLRGAKKIKQI